MDINTSVYILYLHGHIIDTNYTITDIHPIMFNITFLSEGNTNCCLYLYLLLVCMIL